METLGFFSRADMGGYPDEQMKEELRKALEKMNNDKRETSVNYMQVIPDSHRFTLYGLKVEIEKLNAIVDSDIPNKEDLIKTKLNYIITGLLNSEREETDMI